MRRSREEIRLNLQITVSDDAVAAFNALDDATRASVWEGSDDLKRMVLMVIERGIALGMRPGEDGGDGLLLLDGNRRHRCRFTDTEMLLQPATGGEVSFVTNYYGQMQLYQWLEAWKDGTGPESP
jgi:hypothetical protein